MTFSSSGVAAEHSFPNQQIAASRSPSSRKPAFFQQWNSHDALQVYHFSSFFLSIYLTQWAPTIIKKRHHLCQQPSTHYINHRMLLNQHSRQTDRPGHSPGDPFHLLIIPKTTALANDPVHRYSTGNMNGWTHIVRWIHRP